MRPFGAGKGLELLAFIVGAAAVLGLRYFPIKREVRWVEAWSASMAAWGIDGRYTPWGVGAFFGVWSLLAVASWGLGK